MTELQTVIEQLRGISRDLSTSNTAIEILQAQAGVDMCVLQLMGIVGKGLSVPHPDQTAIYIDDEYDPNEVFCEFGEDAILNKHMDMADQYYCEINNK